MKRALLLFFTNPKYLLPLLPSRSLRVWCVFFVRSPHSSSCLFRLLIGPTTDTSFFVPAEFRGPGVHHNFDDSDSGYDVDEHKQGKSFGIGGYRGRIIFLGDGTEVLTDSDDTEMFDNAEEDKDLVSQVAKGTSSAEEGEAAAAGTSEAGSSTAQQQPAETKPAEADKVEEKKNGGAAETKEA